jgi:hypothetical protein
MNAADDDLTVRVVRLEEAVAAANLQRADRDREIRDIKRAVKSIEDKIDLLIADKNTRDGAVGLGKWLVTTGVFGAIGAVALAVIAALGRL